LIQNVPLPQIRARARQWIGHGDDQRPLVATGHQTELYHAGVWVKDVLINAMAQRLGGECMHFAVDTDEPKHLSLHWPGWSIPITDDAALGNAAWSGLLTQPTPRYLDEVSAAIDQAAAQWHFVPSTGAFMQAMRRSSLDEEMNLSAAITNAMHALDWELGMRQQTLVTSPMWFSEPYLVVAYHLLAHAGQWADAYNAALAGFRADHGIRNPGRPMPDLRTDSDRCEAAFWLDDLSDGTRQRATVRRRRGTSMWSLSRGDGEAFALDPAIDGWEAAQQLARWLRGNQLRLSPRALTLTMYLRLAVVDQFVHGIGGGRYDQVTDQLIWRYWGLEPPRFSVTTATLYFPAAVGRQRVCLPCLAREGHRLYHDALGAAKRQLIRGIDAQPRRSRQRYEKFIELHRRLDAAAAVDPYLAEWRARSAAARAQAAEDQSLFDREMFYAIQPRPRLQEVINRYRAALA
jgi:hypothetical protein